MMFSGSKGANARSVLKWIWRNDSSLTTRFLNNVSPEVELSEYRGIPSPGSESPSGLLNGESVNSEQIADLDFFFERLYSYYCDKGLWCIITKWVVELLSLGFTICFSGFFLLFIDWNGLRNAKCGMDAVESGTKPCDLSKEAILKHPLTPLTLSKAIIMGYLGIFSIYWIICFLRFFTQLRDILQIRHFYYSSLHVTDDEIKTMPWATILEKVVQLQNMEQLCVVKDLTAHDVVMRLMRKENYLIGMLNKGVLAFPIYQWVPGAGPNVKSVTDGSRCCLILTKTLEWTLNWCILQSMFDRNFCVRRDFISDPRTLKRRLMVVGLVMLLLSPFLVIFMLVYLFLRHAEQFYNHPSTASSRRWSNLSRWIFREFNEVDHLFKHRINSSVVHASEYLKQFPSPIISIIAKFISFVFGGFAALLIIVAFTDESLLEGHLWGRNLLWYAAVCGTVTAISRAAIPEELLVLDPEGAMSMVVQHTHYMPKRWRSKENTGVVRAEFETLFQYTGMMLLEEMASIFLTPFLLMLVVPKRVDDILQFIADFTVNIEGVGHVCSFSVFDFQKHGNNNYGSPYNSPRNDRSSQGKMEKSFLSFQSVYPSWEPNAEGKQFLSNLTTVRDRMFQGNGARHPHSPSSLGGGESNNFFAREIPHQIPGLPYHLDTLLMINNADGRSRNLYLLDWYYTRRLHDHDNNNNYVRDHHRIIQEEPLENLGERQPEGYWVPPDFTSSQTHLGVSTAIPSFRGSVLRHNDESSSNVGRNSTTRSHWWDRSGPQGTHHHPPQASFLEPPDFNRTMPNDYYDHFSERSSEGEEQHLDWRNYQKLSRTMYVDDTEEVGEFNLHFDDIYRPEEGTS